MKQAPFPPESQNDIIEIHIRHTYLPGSSSTIIIHGYQIMDNKLRHIDRLRKHVLDSLYQFNAHIASYSMSIKVLKDNLNDNNKKFNVIHLINLSGFNLNGFQSIPIL